MLLIAGAAVIVATMRLVGGAEKNRRETGERSVGKRWKIIEERRSPG
jgi:hypothetical protein